MKKWIFLFLLLSLPAAAAELKEPAAGITLRSGETCYVLEFAQTFSEVLSCSEPLQVKYEVRECVSGKASEKGETKALISCEEKKILYSPLAHPGWSDQRHT